MVIHLHAGRAEYNHVKMSDDVMFGGDFLSLSKRTNVRFTGNFRKVLAGDRIEKRTRADFVELIAGCFLDALGKAIQAIQNIVIYLVYLAHYLDLQKRYFYGCLV
jgi:hypothetical protein